MDDRRPDRTVTADPALGVVGLDGLDETAYRALLRRARATPAELAGDLDWPLARVGRVLDRLREVGLVSRLGGRPRRYVAIEPDSALGALVRARGAELERVRELATELTALFHASRAEGGTTGPVQLVTGREAVARWFVRLQQQAQHDMLALDRPPYALAARNPVQRVSLARGVRFRSVYAPESLERPGALEELHDLAARGEQARVMAGLPLKLAVADRSMALMPLTLDLGAMDAAIIRESTLLDALLDLFEFYWERATPIDVASGPATEDLATEDRDMLALLVSGLKDDAIARQLGLSTRTMRRRVRRVLDLLGAENRFQAGVQAVRRGWM